MRKVFGPFLFAAFAVAMLALAAAVGADHAMRPHTQNISRLNPPTEEFSLG
jgi:hypothetical protein